MDAVSARQNPFHAFSGCLRGQSCNFIKQNLILLAVSRSTD
ncbi:hypothetical protein GCWU000324_02439 [Kingella oralis ATCC 51147]|uniref:Uncharacterized protein n=1 Tax=Kingella oralis ATCC 51147 TaxID=629741 RepID=C4GK65_9NEIS|nr:hypothetical protein GCWU000324_02439 [Kingella oralis ATCC 51147]